MRNPFTRPKRRTRRQQLAEAGSDIAMTGLLATAGTTAAAMACGAAEGEGMVAPVNAVSHIVYGDRATRQDDLSLEYTAPGLALNWLAVTSWAALHDRLVKRTSGSRTAHLATGAAVAATAYVVDYYVVPKRLTPGIEKRLSPPSLGLVYGALAGSLALGSLLAAKRDAR